MSTSGLPVSGRETQQGVGGRAIELPPPRIPDYELLRPIGRGGYGEVWLGRSVTGAYRAVKIVRRQTFDSDRPYEREFRGIQAFEPVSLSHDSQLDVLHVGRNDAEGHFYYVLELADNIHAAGQSAAATTDWENYVPHTLREDLRRRERLAFDVCVDLGIRLATALDHLHRHGLIHRDVKPANIVFVNGLPKLADIGLVAPQGESVSFVGTHGYLPPEGPGTLQADVYSLGKVLYEASTGRHRDDFPELPTPQTEGADRAARVEFNEILMRACAREPLRRYNSAAELRSDLLLLQSGGSVKRLRTLERRMRLVGKLGVVALVAGLLGAGGLLYQQRQARRMGELVEQARQRLVRLHVANSLHLEENGDSFSSLVWLVEALKLARSPDEEEIQRRRIAGALRSTPALTLMGAHERAINHAQFSHDGRWLLTVSDDRTGFVWDLESGLPKSRLVGHSGPISHACFSPDALRVVTASDDGTARIWDAATGQLLTPRLQHEGAVFYAWFNPEGRRVVTASADGTARVWDAGTGDPLFEPLRHSDDVEFACFSPNGRLVVTVSRDRTARLWDAHTGQAATPPLAHDQGAVYAAFSPDSRFVVTGSRDGMARVWDVATGNPAGRSLSHLGRVRYLCFSPDGGRFLVAAGEHLVNGEARVWDSATRVPVTPSLPHALHVSHAGFSPDGRWVATASSDQTVRIWDATTGTQLGPTLRHPLAAWFVEFSPDGRYLVTAGRDRIWRLWDLATEASTIEWYPPLTLQRSFTAASWQALTNTFHTGRSFRLPDGHGPLSLSPCGRWIVTSDPNGEALIRDVITSEPLSQPMRHESRIGLARFSPDGTRLLTASLDRSARIWGAPAGQPVTPPLRHRYPVTSASFSPDGARVATATRESTPGGRGDARIWDARTGVPVTAVLEHSASVLALTFSPDGRLLATASGDMTTESHAAQLWDVESGRFVGQYVHEESSIVDVAFSPDGGWLATAGSEGVARIWDVRTHEPVGPPMRSLRGISSVAFSPNGRLLATASADGAVRLWQLPTGVPATVRIIHGASLATIAFSPDGNALTVLRHVQGGSRSAILAIGPERRPFAELENTVETAAGFRISEAGATETMTTAEILEQYHRLRLSMGIGSGKDPDVSRRWHRAQAHESELQGDSFAVRFHRDRLASVVPIPPRKDADPPER